MVDDDARSRHRVGHRGEPLAVALDVERAAMARALVAHFVHPWKSTEAFRAWLQVHRAERELLRRGERGECQKYDRDDGAFHIARFRSRSMKREERAAQPPGDGLTAFAGSKCPGSATSLLRRPRASAARRNR